MLSSSAFPRVPRTGGDSMFRRIGERRLGAFTARTLFALLLPAGQLLAQAGSIAGKVTDDRGAALSGAQVLVDGGTRGAVSGANGTYEVTGVPAGRHQGLVPLIGHPPQPDTLHVSG